MNLLVIPSWYPHRCHPLEGIFLHDQAAALGDLRPDWRIAISLWGQGAGRVSLAHLGRSPLCLLDALRAAPVESPRSANVIEFRSPALSWSESFLHGNREGLLAANRRNLARAAARFGRIDLLHAHVSYPAGWVAMRLSAETGIPYVITEHMGPFPLPLYARADGTLAPFLREPLERAHARIAVSPALCERIAGFGLPRPEYVPNVVDERHYAPVAAPARERFGFFTLCQMEDVKGIPDLLHAIQTVLARLPEDARGRVEWRLGGTGSRFERFRAEGRRLGLDPWVTWLGFMPREEARREYGRCDAFVLASHHESFGIVLVEAAAFGKPVIATRSGGPEATVTAESGVLVAPGRPEELAEAMLAMLRRERTFDATRIREGFMTTYSRPAVVDRLDAIFQGALAGAAARG